MPSLMAAALGMVVSLGVESLIAPFVPVPVKAAVGLVVFFAVAYRTRRYLTNLRDGGG